MKAEKKNANAIELNEIDIGQPKLCDRIVVTDHASRTPRIPPITLTTTDSAKN